MTRIGVPSVPPGTFGPPIPPGTYAQGLTATAVKTAPYTAVPKDYVLVDTTAGTVAITLPTAPADGTRIGIKLVAPNPAVNVATFSCGGSDHINLATGPTSGTITLVNQAVILQYATSTAVWTVQSSDLPLSGLDSRFQATIPSGTFVGPAAPVNGASAATVAGSTQVTGDANTRFQLLADGSIALGLGAAPPVKKLALRTTIAGTNPRGLEFPGEAFSNRADTSVSTVPAMIQLGLNGAWILGMDTAGAIPACDFAIAPLYDTTGAAGRDELYIASNWVTTTLAAPVNNVATTITTAAAVTTISGTPNNYVRVGAPGETPEIMQVTAGSGTTSLTVVRNADGGLPAPVAHASGARVITQGSGAASFGIGYPQPPQGSKLSIKNDPILVTQHTLSLWQGVGQTGDLLRAEIADSVCHWKLDSIGRMSGRNTDGTETYLFDMAGGSGAVAQFKLKLMSLGSAAPTTPTATLDVVQSGANNSSLKLRGDGGSFEIMVLAASPYTASVQTKNAGPLTLGSNNVIRAILPVAGSVVVGTPATAGTPSTIPALATSATDGFLCIPTCAGTPTGVPSNNGATTALVYDTANDKLYAYRGGWKTTLVFT